MLIQKVVSKNLKGLRNTKNAKTTPLAKNKGFFNLKYPDRH
ncbi:hypothetical protein HPHPA11_1221 [Helicobacter pylori Hp A-11]|uniref:Uncharacterized protein n=1 Tax=Helicobacter pylori Hp A-11 TaxID=992035 RepID=N4TR43_HELPX|nr:hypothetical protein HPHPA11_1221 [Helicobacter pylori Hp A-11]